jgi:hypothetical protein
MEANTRVDVAIVGAGAAGLATAIFIAQMKPAWSVVALDGAKKIGAKILVSGGGRCNVTNRAVGPEDFNGGSRKVTGRILSCFTVEQTIDFFRRIGVEMHEEEHGKMFPDSNRAHTVLDALLAEAERCGVRVLPDHRVTDVRGLDDGFALACSGRALKARIVVLATGGLSLPKTGSDGGGYAFAKRLGHSVVPTTPALVPLIVNGDFHVGLSGISQNVELTVSAEGRKASRFVGSLLWTHFGISGPVVLDASRHWLRAVLEDREPTVTANLVPGSDFASLEGEMLRLARTSPKAALSNVLSRRLPVRVANATLLQLGIDGRTPLAHLPREARRKLINSLLRWTFPVSDSRGYTYAEATAGGVPLTEIDSRSMLSRKCQGLYLVGEILDVDGRIGGFNFQWAWSSAFAAATAMTV